MKLELDCIREVLIEVEKRHRISVDDDNSVTFEVLWVEELYEALPKRNKEDIFYAIYNLGQAGLLDISMSDGDNGIAMCGVTCMTYKGHEFLEKVRDAKQWKAIKGILNAIRNYSLDAINQAANGAANGAITAALSKIEF